MLNDIVTYYTQTKGMTKEEAQNAVNDSVLDVIRPKLYEAIESGNSSSAKMQVAEMKKYGRDDAAIIKALSTKYHKIWKEYYDKGETQKRKNLEQVLYSLGLINSWGEVHYNSGTFADWEKDYWKEKEGK